MKKGVSLLSVIVYWNVSLQRLSLEDEDFARSLGELINEVGLHLLEAFDPLELEVSKGQASEQSLGLLALTSAMLTQLLPVAFACFEQEDSDVRGGGHGGWGVAIHFMIDMLFYGVMCE